MAIEHGIEGSRREALVHLEQALRTVSYVAERILRDKHIRDRLDETEGDDHIKYWRAFFQVVLARPFGTIMPGVEGWMPFATEFNNVYPEQFGNGQEIKERIAQYLEWCNATGNRTLYTVAQFWNADDLRAAAFVVRAPNSDQNSLSPVLSLGDINLKAESKDWNRRWELMDTVNRKRGSESQLLATNIGNFIVERCEDLLDTCPIFELRIGVGEKFECIAEILERFENEPNPATEQEFEGCVVSVVDQLKSRGKNPSTFFEHLEVPDEVFSTIMTQLDNNYVHDLSIEADSIIGLTNHEMWASKTFKLYLLYARVFFFCRYYLESDTVDSKADFQRSGLLSDQLKLMLLNNLRIAHPLPGFGSAKGESAGAGSHDTARGFETLSRHCQYCIPAWHRSASYLFVVTLTPLDEDELHCFRRFANELFGLAWAVDSARKLEQDKVAFVKQARRAARAAIMSRNLSHNVGSHVLANPRLHAAIGLDQFVGGLKADATDKLRDRTGTSLGTFHHYIQARLDFIARAISPLTERLEPLFFRGDVLARLFHQKVLLETLVSDLNFPQAANGSQRTREISFHVQLDISTMTNSDWIYVYRLDADSSRFELAGVCDENGEWPTVQMQTGDDLLIGLPGGVIGSQALYAFIENVMRNAAKYGDNRLRANEFVIHLRLRDPRPCETSKLQDFFVLEIWENLSDGGVAETVRHIREYIAEDLIKEETGELASQGHGIQEMKIAADFLSGQACFEPDKLDSQCGCPYCTFVRSDGKTFKDKKDVECGLRCFGEQRETTNDKTCRLVYQMLIPKARLVGVVDTSGKSGLHFPDGTQSVYYCNSVHALATYGAAFGVILDDGQAVDQWLAEIHRYQHALPYRLMVLADGDRILRWQQALGETWQTATLKGHWPSDAEERFNPKVHLPPRRLHFISNEDLRKTLRDGAPQSQSSAADSRQSPEFVGTKGWDATILQLYHLWLEVFKGLPFENTWKIAISFERPSGQVVKRWSQLKAFDPVLPTSAHPPAPSRGANPNTHGGMGIELHLFELDADKSAPSGKATAIRRDMLDGACFGDKQRYVLFDNHGASLGRMAFDLAYGVRVYHPFSGSRQLALAHTLEAPPDSPFAFAYFIYRLLESSLTNIVVVDDRVAQAVGGSLPHDLSPHTSFQLARIFPLFSIGNGPRVTRLAKPPNGADSAWLDEGLRFNEQAVQMRVVVNNGPHLTPTAPAGPITETCIIGPIDAVIIHEGAVEVAKNDGAWPSPSGDPMKDGDIWHQYPESLLGAWTPRVIRTSGRGPDARHLYPKLPFLEFSELSETTYGRFNKPLLSTAVLSLCGHQ